MTDARQNKILDIDVRNQDEYAAWQIEGTRTVPMKNVPIWVAVEESEALAQEIPDDTVVVCAHGNGSDLLIDVLKDEGRDVRTLEGGTAAWAELIENSLPGATLFRAGADGAPGVPRFSRQTPAIETITQRLRQQFDPAGIFNPGRT